MNRSWSGYRIGVVLLAVIALGVAGNRLEMRMTYGPGPLSAPRTVVIPKHAHIRDIAHDLDAAGVVGSWWRFGLAVLVFDRGAPLHPGEYAFAAGQSLFEVIRELREGRTVVHHLTIPEGLTVAEIAALIGQETALAGPVGPLPSEGRLMPETYNFSLDDPRGEMVARMRKAMDKVLDADWAARAPGLSLLNQEAALTLASIVEKETALTEERPKVAAVFLNRLAKGMKLQADPTVIYALTGGKGPLGRPLAHEDLAIDSPYNSYQREGLPPTPIDCPSRASLLAVLHPAAISDLYFVADGAGHHVFAQTLDEHNRNVTHLRQLEGKLPMSGQQK